MLMRMKIHAQLRIFLMFAGFLGGLALVMIVQRDLGSLAFVAAGLIFPFAGAFGLPLAFTSAVKAACPKCGGEAVAGWRTPANYLCRNCQSATIVAVELIGDEATMRAQAAVMEKEEPSRRRRFLGIFLLLGAVAFGIGVFLAIDSFSLVLKGVSTPAQVTNVTSTEGRDSDGNRVTNFRARIQYQAGGRVHALERNWSESPNSRCFAGCYSAGERLKVIYLAEDPSVAKVHSIVDLYLTPGLPLSVGLLFMIFAVAMLRNKS